MVSLKYPREFQAVRYLPFCYLCGTEFTDNDVCDGDHVPPQAVFAKADRFPLKLKTHKACNSAHHLVDQKMGQLVGLRRGYLPSDPKHRHLDIRVMNDGRAAALVNVDVHGAIWRWVRGVHAALYRVPLAELSPRALETPFPTMKMGVGAHEPEPIRPQHLAIVETIKLNRAKGNIDRILNNNGKMTYECVWAQSDNDGPWLCFFALDVYAWKDLGDPRFGQRGCAGLYRLETGGAPEGATKAARSAIIPPNSEPLDPFGR